MTSETVRTLIAEAIKQEATHLDLWASGLTELPPEIGKLTNLTHIFLLGNRLTKLPPEIGQLTGLTHLDLRGNNLKELPPEIGQLTGLALLDLSENRLAEVPPEIGKLTGLNRLYLASNRLAALPQQIGGLLRKVDLHVRGNPLRDPPVSVVRKGSRTTRRYFVLKWLERKYREDPRSAPYPIVWWNDAASRAAGIDSGVAMLQTVAVVAGGLVVTGMGYYLPLLWATLLAPFLLMRTEPSTEDALRRHARMTERLGLMRDMKTYATETMFPLNLVVLGPGSLWIRVVVALSHLLRYPSVALKAIPGNLRHHLAQAGIFTPPELIPGAERGATKDGREVLASYDLLRDFRLSRRDDSFGSIFDRETPFEDLTAAALFSLGLFYVIAFLWRLGLRFAGAVYWPFLLFQPRRIESQRRQAEQGTRFKLWLPNPTLYLQLALLGGAIALLGINIPPEVLADTLLGDFIKRGMMIAQHLPLEPSLAANWAAWMLIAQVVAWFGSMLALDYRLTLDAATRKGAAGTRMLYHGLRVAQSVLLVGVTLCVLIVVPPIVFSGLAGSLGPFPWFT